MKVYERTTNLTSLHNSVILFIQSVLKYYTLRNRFLFLQKNSPNFTPYLKGSYKKGILQTKILLFGLIGGIFYSFGRGVLIKLS